MGAAPAHEPLAPGQLRRRRQLGTEAVYRVLAVTGDMVRVEVIRAPGLTAGAEFRFSARDVTGMELVSEHAAPDRVRRQAG
jgi:hypothetical protein